MTLTPTRLSILGLGLALTGLLAACGTAASASSSSSGSGSSGIAASQQSPTGGEKTFCIQLQSMEIDEVTMINSLINNGSSSVSQSDLYQDGLHLGQAAQDTPWVSDAQTAGQELESGQLSQDVKADQMLDGDCASAGYPVQDEAIPVMQQALADGDS